MSKRNEFVDLGYGLSAAVMDVSPKIAKAWLDNRPEEQRSISYKQVQGMVADIQAGAWRLTHQGVALDEEDRPIDGQHRLTAVAESGQTVTMLVIRSSSAKVEDPIDRGRPRSVAFVSGHSNKATAAMAVLLGLEQGYPSSHGITVNESSIMWEHHGDAIETVLGFAPGSTLVSGLLAAAVWAYPLASKEIEKFIRQVHTGEMISKGQPAYAYRSWRERERRANSWEMCIAALGCMRAVIQEKTMASVHADATDAYRWVTMRRRALKIPHTPSAQLVPPPGGKSGKED